MSRSAHSLWIAYKAVLRSGLHRQTESVRNFKLPRITT